MDSKLQQKLRERREKAALEAIAGKLSGFSLGFGSVPGGEPPWLRAAIDRFQDIRTDPDDVISDETASGELDAWIQELLTRNGVAGHFYVKTHVAREPWVECRVAEGGGGWAALVREAIEDPWIFLAADLSRLIVICETEYHFAAYASRAD
ncbi:hypothetical protein ACFQ7F_13395 [Streptomyces sp. NPDC056486]|uniref:hypothetical protein n=1 Tax=Streptomyces sp. NPDC056486 TaxID=3345835 RepID=UPI00369F97B1